MRLACLLAVALLLLAACNGGENGGEGDTTAFCDEFENFIETTQTTDQSTPEGLEKAMGESLESLEKVAAALPSDQAELQEDVESLIEVFRRIVSLLEEAGWDQTKVDPKEYEDLLSSQSELSETQQQLMSYGQENCDLASVTSTPDATAPPDGSLPPAGTEGSEQGTPITPSDGQP